MKKKTKRSATDQDKTIDSMDRSFNKIEALYRKEWRRDPTPAGDRQLKPLAKELGFPVPEDLESLLRRVDGYHSFTGVSLRAVVGSGYGASILSYLRHKGWKDVKSKGWPRKDWIPIGSSYGGQLFCLLAERRFGEHRPIGVVDPRSYRMKYVVASSLAAFLEMWLSIGLVANDDWHFRKREVLAIDPGLRKFKAYSRSWEVPREPVFDSVG